MRHKSSRKLGKKVQSYLKNTLKLFNHASKKTETYYFFTLVKRPGHRLSEIDEKIKCINQERKAGNDNNVLREKFVIRREIKLFQKLYRPVHNFTLL